MTERLVSSARGAYDLDTGLLGERTEGIVWRQERRTVDGCLEMQRRQCPSCPRGLLPRWVLNGEGRGSRGRVWTEDGGVLAGDWRALVAEW